MENLVKAAKELRIVTEIGLLFKGNLVGDSPFAFAGYAIIGVFTLLLVFLYLTTDMPFRTFIIGPAVMVACWFLTSFAHSPAVYRIVDKVIGTNRD
nr:hypothetical protein [uncultured Rhodopila sp.]